MEQGGSLLIHWRSSALSTNRFPVHRHRSFGWPVSKRSRLHRRELSNRIALYCHIGSSHWCCRPGGNKLCSWALASSYTGEPGFLSWLPPWHIYNCTKHHLLLRLHIHGRARIHWMYSIDLYLAWRNTIYLRKLWTSLRQTQSSPILPPGMGSYINITRIIGGKGHSPIWVVYLSIVRCEILISVARKR